MDKKKPSASQEPYSITYLSLGEINVHSIPAQKVLQQRAEQLAEKKAPQEVERHEQFLRFRLGQKEHYGIPYPYPVNIIRLSRMITVPGAPLFIAGIINQHSEILSVINLGYFFGIKQAANEKNSWVIIAQINETKIGFLANEILGDSHYATAELTAPFPSNEILKIEFIKGIYMGEVALLNIETIFHDKTIQIHQKQIYKSYEANSE